MDIQEQFEKFYENIKITPFQKEDAITKYSGVCKKLHDYYYPDIEYNGNTKLLVGSYGKRTHIRPARDIDVIFIIPSEKYEQYEDNLSNGQSQLLQDVKNILQEKYLNTPIKASGKVVVLEFADTKHNVELLPAWENEDGSFTIPNSESGGYWEQWNPRSEIKRISDSDSKTKRTRMLIRMIKKWAENCSVRLRSYQIENKVVDYLSVRGVSNNKQSELVRDFFKYFLQTTTNNDLKSYLNTAFIRASKACDFEDEAKIKKATEEWQKVFGDDFPIISQKELSSEVKPVLADYSHCEPLKWDFISENKIRIDAYIYNGTKTKKLGGINSDGRNLSKGLYLKYIAKTNADPEFQYYWQIVNTGQAAQLAKDLRGNIFLGKQVHWESTEYKGKHWIECFIVQDNYCIARSGRFFVNIK